MATDNEQLVLSISADTRQIQRQLKSLVGQTQANTKAIEDAFKGIDSASSGAFDRVAANSNKAFTTAANGARQFERAMNTSRLQTANLAAQLNDIGVQLAGGQSPFLIALQQGTQITQALGSGTGLRGAVTAVAGAFTSLINPVSLATIGIIALGGTAIQYFSELLSSGEATEQTLAKQAQLIRQVADKWGDAVPALREYADELQRAQETAELNKSVEIINETKLAETRAKIDETKVSVSDLVSQLQAAGEETETIVAIQDAFNRFASAANDGSLKVEDVKNVQDALATAINNTGLPALADFKTMFDEVSASALGVAANVQKVNEAVAQAQATMNDPRTWRGANSIGNPEGAMQGSSDPDLPMTGPVPEGRGTPELSGFPYKKTSGDSARSKAIKEAERERKAVVDLIEQLEFEQSMIGKTAAERAEANALRRAGAAATDEQKAKISALVEATYAERDAIRANEEAMRELQDISRDVLEGLVSDLKEGKSGADILANALGRIGDRLLSSALDGLFSTKAPGTSGGLLGGAIIPGILHDGGIAGRDGYGHGRAVSPSAFSGAKRYHGGGIAGLRPDEVPAILQRGERIIPRGGSAGGSSVSAPVSIMIDATGADTVGLARVERQIEALKADLPGAVVKTVKDAQKRRVL